MSGFFSLHLSNPLQKCTSTRFLQQQPVFWIPELYKLKKWFCMCPYLDDYQGVTQNSRNVQRCSKFAVDNGVYGLSLHFTQPNCSSSGGKFRCFQSKDRSKQLGFIKSLTGDYLFFSTSKQKPLLSFDTFSYQSIMWSLPLMMLSDLRGLSSTVLNIRRTLI